MSRDDSRNPPDLSVGRFKFNDRELLMIYNLLKERKEDGSYFGNKKHYYARLDSAISKIEKEFNDRELK